MQQPPPRTSTTTRQISCRRCQKRKIKCSRTDPCINCAILHLACEYRDDGSRRFPVTRDYVASLEARVASLEAFIAQRPGGEEQPTTQENSSSSATRHHGGPLDASLLPEDQDGTGSASSPTAPLVYHGPTSIYSGAFTTLEPPSDYYANNSTSTDNNNDHVLHAGSSAILPYLDAGERRVSECIALFFHWQYPQFMFIDREAFILDFRSGTLGGRFCSSALVNAICSIGALVSRDSDTRRVAGDFAGLARGLLLSGGGRGKPLPAPHVTHVQALLCCGFYEIGLGNFSDGWLYSGMAFRMGQDLGFQRDPDTWTKRGSKTTLEANQDTEREKEFRRRIYWGCYISDKFFSLFLGRPCFLHELDADVKPSQPKPQDPIFNNWVLERNLGHLQDRFPLIPKLTLVFNKQIEIGTVIREGLSMVYSPRAQQQQHHSGDFDNISLSGINAKLSRFRDRLPPEMRIKEWSSLTDPVQPHLAVMHALYHSTLISLNRPFLNHHRSLNTVPAQTTAPHSQHQMAPGGSNTSRTPAASPAAICTQSAERLLQILKRFKTQHGLCHAPLVLVHGTISAISALLAVHVREAAQAQATITKRTTTKATTTTTTTTTTQHHSLGSTAGMATTGGDSNHGNSKNKSHALTVVREFAALLPEFEDTWVIAKKARRRTVEIIERLAMESADDTVAQKASPPLIEENTSDHVMARSATAGKGVADQRSAASAAAMLNESEMKAAGMIMPVAAGLGTDEQDSPQSFLQPSTIPGYYGGASSTVANRRLRSPTSSAHGPPSQMEGVWFTNSSNNNNMIHPRQYQEEQQNQHHQQQQQQSRNRSHINGDNSKNSNTAKDDNDLPRQQQPQAGDSCIPQSLQDLAWLEDILLLPEYSMDIINSPGDGVALEEQAAGGDGFP